MLWRCWFDITKSICPSKNWVMRCWCGYLSGARCSWCHCHPKTPPSLVSFKSRLVLPFWYPACKKLRVVGAGMVICLEQGADLQVAQLMPLSLTVSCFSKIQIVLPFWYQLTRVVPEKGPLNGCVYNFWFVVRHSGGDRSVPGDRPRAVVTTAWTADWCEEEESKWLVGGWTAGL